MPFFGIFLQLLIFELVTKHLPFFNVYPDIAAFFCVWHSCSIYFLICQSWPHNVTTSFWFSQTWQVVTSVQQGGKTRGKIILISIEKKIQCPLEKPEMGRKMFIKTGVAPKSAQNNVTLFFRRTRTRCRRKKIDKSCWWTPGYFLFYHQILICGISSFHFWCWWSNLSWHIVLTS